MLETEASILRWRKASDDLRCKAVDAATAVYLDALGTSECPGPADLQAATGAASSCLMKEVVSLPWTEAISGTAYTQEQVAQLELCFTATCPELRLPAPQIIPEVSPLHLGVAAVVGAFGGMLILTPLTRILLGMEDVGLFVGAPIGAFLLVVATCYTIRSKWLRGLLVFAFGAAAAVEVWRIVPSASFFSQFWKRLRGQGSLLKRLAFYAVAILVLLIAKPRPRYDRTEHERLTRSAIDAWLDAAILTIGLLVEPTKTEGDAEANLSELAMEVLELRRVPPENLPAARDELLQSLRNMGFETQVQGQNVLRWENEHRDRYDVFGYVEPADEVIVEREPVVLHGVVRQKGLVRKLRERN